MKIIIEIETDNAAFEDDYKGELYRVLGAITAHIHQGLETFPIKDTNGNVIGFFKTIEE